MFFFSFVRNFLIKKRKSGFKNEIFSVNFVHIEQTRKVPVNGSVTCTAIPIKKNVNRSYGLFRLTKTDVDFDNCTENVTMCVNGE